MSVKVDEPGHLQKTENGGKTPLPASTDLCCDRRPNRDTKENAVKNGQNKQKKKRERSNAT